MNIKRKRLAILSITVINSQDYFVNCNFAIKAHGIGSEYLLNFSLCSEKCKFF